MAATRIGHILQHEGVYYPQKISELQDLVKYANAEQLKMRVVGSGHAPLDSIFGDAQIKINLDGEFREIKPLQKYEGGRAVVTAGAGCNLGRNPADMRSTWENSFNDFLDKAGYALSLLGGIDHQTLGGFLQTSSSGGSTLHGVVDNIVAIDVMDGLGEVHTFTKDQPEFNAVVVAMGLCGIVVSVTFDVAETYNVKGVETTKAFSQSILAKDEQGGRRELRRALSEKEFFHLNWLPQKEVNAVMTWEAEKVSANTLIKPYVHPLRSSLVALPASAALGLSNVIDSFGHQNAKLAWAKSRLIKLFVTEGETQVFCDKWNKALPIDNQVAGVNSYFKLLFSEIWFPLDAVDEVMDILEELFAQDASAAGNFIVELYAAKATPFYMSPSYQRDSLRLDLYWWEKNFGNAMDYFAKFWGPLLTKVKGARLHPGKYMPEPGVSYGGKVFSAQDLVGNYPKYEEWLKVREKLDPHQVFVTSYWRKRLGIPMLAKELTLAAGKKEEDKPVAQSYLGWINTLWKGRKITPDQEPENETSLKMER